MNTIKQSNKTKPNNLTRT